MRLRRLDLTRYGKFTDQAIDFGEHIDGEPDLHLVYGPNEAGKSTALSAYLDLLYGIEPRSTFNFKHAYQAMQIGATLVIGGAIHRVTRCKRLQNSLLDSDGRAVSEHIVLGPLGGIDRESYRARFSLDDDTLEKGGDAILESRGDLGQALFSASAGLADFSRALTGLREEAELFYKPHARSTELAELKAAVARLKQEREALDTAASKYATLTDARDRAGRLYDEAVAERGAIQARINDVQRRLSALPRLASLRGLREKLVPLADLPDAPAGWLESIPALREEETAIAVRLSEADREIAERIAEIEAITVDETALGVADKVDAWADARARAITAGKDIPERRIEVQREDRAIAVILARLGRPEHADPASLLLPATTIGTIRALLERRSGIEAQCHAAAHERDKALALRDAAQAELGAFAGGTVAQEAIDSIAGALRALQNGEHAAQRRLATRTLAACRDEAADRLAALQPWDGDLEQLARLIVPDPEQIQRWKTAQAAAEETQRRIEAELVRFRQERLILEAETIIVAGSTISEAAAARAAREAAWASHRRALDGETADAFEAAMRRDDLVADARARETAETEAFQKAHMKIASLAAQEGQAREDVQAARAARDRLGQEVATSLAGMAPPLPSTTTLPQLESWLGRRNEALRLRTQLQQAERDARTAENDHVAARDRLRAVLAAASMAHDTEAEDDILAAAAQAALDRASRGRVLRQTLVDRERELAARQRDFEQAADEDARWRAAWSAACETDLLRGLGTPENTATVREILVAAGDLGPALDRRAALLDRIEKMGQDEAAFAQETHATAGVLGIEAAGAATLELDRKISAVVRDARAARDLKVQKTKQLAQARQRQRDAQAQEAQHARRKAGMTDRFAVDTLAAVEVVLRAIARRSEWRAQAADLEREIVETLRTPSLAAAENVLDDADRTALEADLSTLQARFEDCDRRIQTLYSERSKATDQVEAVGGDAAVAALEAQRRTVLLDIEERARQYLKLRAGIAAAERALHAYRREHRSFMQHASDAFRTISRDAYGSLTSQPERDGEVLVAVAADGASRIAPKLSKGTRFQLYLALRVAGYREFARHREPVPFIADDIMETFDDFRAEAALQVFADMSTIGQVIYLTHHQHLCDIARTVCPQIRLHTLVA